jgi:hypothetical protein
MGCFSPPLSPFAFDSVPPYGPSPCGHVASLLSKLPTSLQQFCKNLLCIEGQKIQRDVFDSLLRHYRLHISCGALRRERPTK